MSLDLPLTEIPSRGDTTDVLAVILSGDGGWRLTERKVAGNLAARGVAVAGLDSLRYFWNPRTPEGASADLARVIERYSKDWMRSRVALIGYSFGADVLPFLINRLPASTRGRVSLVVLLGLGFRADFRFHLSDWLGRPSRDALPVLPELEKLRGTPVLCIYGEREKGCPCRDLDPGLVNAIPRKGGHLIWSGWKGIAGHVLDALGIPGGNEGDGRVHRGGRNEREGPV